MTNFRLDLQTLRSLWLRTKNFRISLMSILTPLLWITNYLNQAVTPWLFLSHKISRQSLVKKSLRSKEVTTRKNTRITVLKAKISVGWDLEYFLISWSTYRRVGTTRNILISRGFFNVRSIKTMKNSNSYNVNSKLKRAGLIALIYLPLNISFSKLGIQETKPIKTCKSRKPQAKIMIMRMLNLRLWTTNKIS